MSGCDKTINCLLDLNQSIHGQHMIEVIDDVCHKIACDEKTLLLHNNVYLCLIKECEKVSFNWTYSTSVFITTAAADAAATVLFSQHFKQ